MAIDPDSNGFQLLQFLGKNPKKGFKPSEIADVTDIPRGSVGVVLSRLEMTIKHDDIINPQGSLTDAVTDEIATNAAEYLGALS